MIRRGRCRSNKSASRRPLKIEQHEPTRVGEPVSDDEYQRLTRLKNRCRRESNPHLRFRKPLFYPLNYGNNDLERINGLNGDGQDTLATPSDFSRDQLRARLSAAYLRVSWRGVFPVNPYGCRG